MLNGIPYDSEVGVAWAGALSAILSGHGYLTSAEIASNVGAFAGFDENRASMLDVMRMHRDEAHKLDEIACPQNLRKAAHEDWDACVRMGERFGYRNSQISVIAPTGTIAFLMDCDTTGVEPDFALVKFKKLAGGGSLKIVNQAVPKALAHLDYPLSQIDEIVAYIVGTGTLKGVPYINERTLKDKGFTDQDLRKIEQKLPNVFSLGLAFAPGILGDDCLKRLGIDSAKAQEPGFNVLSAVGFRQEEIDAADEIICGYGTVEGAPYLKEVHYPIFDCANKCGRTGTRFIEPMGHVRMMAAVQPFISGAISKTVNLTNDATVEDITQVYVEAWKLGVKCLAVYRDGSKSSQPLSSSNQQEEKESHPVRKRLPDLRDSITHKFSVGGHKGYLTVGMYEDGRPGEIFLNMAKDGSVISGLMNTIALMTSVSLQHGVPLEFFVNKFSHIRFEPSGFTNNKDIPIAKSIIDYVFRWLGLQFLPDSQIDGDEVASLEDQLAELRLLSPLSSGADADKIEAIEAREKQVTTMQSDAPPCHACGTIMTRSGTCYRCANCGATSGCS
jgi:ribonucleoside-diphosphate reductase alpha chain